jgi:hypothetical protein
MVEKRMEDMIYEALEGGGEITQDKGHDQKLRVALMSSKGSFGNVCLFHMYLVVAQMKIKFSEELGATQFIQEVINDRNGEFVFDGKFVEGMEFRKHSPRTFFLQDHDHRRRVGPRTREDNTCIRSSWTIFSISFFCKRGDDMDGYWEEGFRVPGEWNDHEHHEKEGVLGEWKIPIDV